MKWTLHPENKDLTTTLPLSVTLSEWQGKPRVILEGAGELELKPQGKNLVSEFYFALPGQYTLEIKDEGHHEIIELQIKEHRYLNFTSEFGFFFILFLFVMGGIFLWTKKIMQKKMR